MNDRKIFCIGLSRTGTTSVSEELSLLGIPSIHYPSSLFFFPKVIDQNLAFKESTRKGLYAKWRFSKELKAKKKSHPAEKILEMFTVFADLPIPSLYKSLDCKFPRSKFIYTYRSEKGWLKSMKWMLEEGKVLWNWGFADFEILQATYHTTTYNESKLLEVYRKHDAEVRSYFANRQSDILFIDIENEKEIMQKIGDFLGISIVTKSMKKSNNARKVSKTAKLMHAINRRFPLSLILNKLK